MTLFKHEIKAGCVSLIAWTASISALISVCIFIYPQMKNQMVDISKAFSDMGSFSSAFGMDKINFGDFMGYFSIECGNVLGLGGAFFAALLGITALSKEESGHTADFLLTHPISRLTVLLQKLTAGICQVVLLNAVVLSAIIICCAAVGEKPDMRLLMQIMMSYLIMQIDIFCICFGISAFIGNKSIGIGLGVAVSLYFLNLISNLTDKAEFLKFITPFSCTDCGYILENRCVNMKYMIVGIAVSVMLASVGALWYNNKDIS